MARIVYLLTVLLLSLSALTAQQVAIGGYPLLVDSEPDGITVGPDGALWFTEGNGRIGRITTAGAVTDYPVLTASSGPQGITAGPDGALWFTESFGNKIGRITVRGVVSEYAVPTSNSYPIAITAGPDGALWFTEYYGNNIGRITTSGTITEYPVSTATAGLWGITLGPDGALWFAESQGENIGRITTGGLISEYSVSVPSNPVGITAGPDGALWFTYDSGVGRISTAGMVSEYAISGLYGAPFGIATGPDGALWFTQWAFKAAGSISRITTAGVVTEYTVPGGYTNPYWITTGPDGALWFSEFTGNRIGQVVFPAASLSASPSSGAYRTTLTFTGSGFAANERVQVYKSGVGSAVLASATTDASGSFTAMVGEPQSAYGPRLFLGVGQTSGSLGAASFSVTARLNVSPSSGPVGSTATVQGFGFGAGEAVKVYWVNPATLLGEVIANADGTFSGSAALTFTVPTAPVGLNRLRAIGYTTKANGFGSFTVQ